MVQQPAGTFAKLILSRLLIDLSSNSSRLEGNTYSLLDTRRLIVFGEEAEGRDRLEAQMILNHKGAIEFLVSAADEIGFNRYTILNLHAILAYNLLPDEAAAVHITSWTQDNIAPAEQDRFREMAEGELLSLQEGNYARYQIRPAEFAAWQEDSTE